MREGWGSTYRRRHVDPIHISTHGFGDVGCHRAGGVRGCTVLDPPLSVGDREAFRTLFASLSLESRRRRFLTGTTELSDRELTYLTDVDHVRHEALAAIDLRDGSIVGVARYISWPERAGAADVAIEVADELQSNGIGLMLAEPLIRRAYENGINVLTATTLWENRAARALARRVGFRARSSAGSEIELELELPHGAEDTTAHDYA